jgi:hypothetical protein
MNLVESIRKDLNLLEAPLELDHSTVLQLTADDGNKGPNWAIHTNVPQSKIMEWAKDLYKRVLKYYRNNPDKWFDEFDANQEVAPGIEMLDEFKKAFGKDYRIDEPRVGEKNENIQLAVYLKFKPNRESIPEPYDETATCDECKGDGYKGVECDECSGMGKLDDEEGNFVECSACDGEGYFDETCDECGGYGEVSYTEYEDVDHYSPILELVIYDGSAYIGDRIYSKDNFTGTNQEVFQ